ncbi:steroid receptor RNA activator 1-like [Periplaneta americana]|uniref:steroid receptor RNA activator 1-like n=1 Tax=Periplaneta americana TaxID=6978 RepID=UPI0037E86BC0
MDVKHMDEGDDEMKTKVTHHDPGWNDPPLFSYDSVSQSKTPKRGLLNKRVAFPLSSQSPSNVPPSTSVLPPLSTPASISNLPTVASKTTEVSNTTAETVEESSLGFQKEEALQRVTEAFEKILKDAADNVKKNESEIRRRLDIMKKMWEEDKLKPEIYSKMIQLSEALRNGNVDVADRIHVGLMVDHVSVCSPWMVGVRHLIHHVKSQAENTETQAEHTETS